MEPVIRHATENDLEAINDIYNRYIVDSHVSFDADAWDMERRREWWSHYAGRVLVVEVDGAVVGTAFAGPWRHKAAYASSTETTVVLDPSSVGLGLGTALLGALLDLLTDQGYHRAYAIIALPNDASVALHRKAGYRKIGILDEVGRKMDRYWSTMLMEKRLS